MNHWIVPSNKIYFDVPKAFKRYGMIDWHKLCNYKVGDIVYLYLSAPDKRIAYKCVVTIETVKDSEVLDDSDFYVPPYNKETYIEGNKIGKTKKFSRFKLIEETKTVKLSFESLKKVGFTSNFRGPLKNLTKEQIDYIESCFSKPYQAEPMTQVNFNEDKYEEGAAIEAKTIVYERKRENRQACIAHYGTKCQVCGIDLGKEYGKVGEGYIEVHHIIPLAKSKGTHKVDPIKDLIPVCPNCHRMIHQAEAKGYDIYSLDKIKKLFNKL